jgi:multidrug efflux pump subunit AcrA (membrane-fusion protein)
MDFKPDSRVTHLSSFGKLKESYWTRKGMGRLLWAMLIIVVIFLFLPWTQNIRSDGKVTTLLPSQRPQEVQTVIGGRLVQWMVREGDTVRKGDTIVLISEIKDNYLDPGLLDQTELQVKSKEQSLEGYGSKVNAISRQINNLEAIQDLKYRQAKNKVAQEKLKLNADMAELQAAQNDLSIARTRYSRDSVLLIQGLKSPLDLEGRKLKLQESIAKLNAMENKYDITKAALANAEFELRNVLNEYGEKLAKAESERFSAVSGQMETEAEISKLRNTLSNYKIRSGFYVVTAPQDGIITRALTAGIGETVKEGAAICSIMPLQYRLAVEMYLDPMDLPLIRKGSKVRFLFDGWPALVFSGWPAMTYGTFPGAVVAIDAFPGKDGKYRVLVAPQANAKVWPDMLRVGSGARGIALLGRVPVWYEIWRQLNGFPPDFYYGTVKPETTVPKKQ